MTYSDLVKGKLDDLSSTAGAAVSDLSSGVVAGQPILASQFADVKNALEDLREFVDEFRGRYYYTPVGVVVPFAGSSANIPPAGWFVCDGQAVSRSTYSDLFSVIGTEYGTGDGSTTFNVPDLRGRVPFGLNSANSDVDDLSDNDGIVTLANRRPRHAHSASTSVAAHDLNHGHGASVSDPGHAHAIGARPNSTSGATYNAATTASNLGDNGNVVRAATTGISVTVNSTGTWTVGHSASTSVGPGAPGAGGTPTDTVPYIVVNYLIKA